MKKIYVLFLCLSSASFVSAFSPIGHMILADSVAARLPKGNIIRQCMEEFPEMARIGSVGPDLPATSVYLHGMSLLHYHKVGTLARLFLQDALRPTLTPGYKLTNEQKAYIAFAAGWISHIGGDFGSHQYFIYPLAGIYLSGNPVERDRHSRIEELTDSWIYTNYAQGILNVPYKDNIVSDKSQQHKFFRKVIKKLVPLKSVATLNSIDTKINSLIDSVLRAQKSTFMKVKKNTLLLLNIGRLKKKLQPNFKFDDEKFFSCLTGKPEDKNTLVKNAFEYGINFTKDILLDASENKYTRISDNWNLDVGPENGNPTYTVVFKFGKLFAGTRGRLNFILQNKNNVKDTFELTEETLGHQVTSTDRGRVLYELKSFKKVYYYHIYPEGPAGRGFTDRTYDKHCPDPALYNFRVQNLEGFYIQFYKRGNLTDVRINMMELEIWQNGTRIYKKPKDVEIKLNRKKKNSTALIKLPQPVES